MERLDDYGNTNITVATIVSLVAKAVKKQLSKLINAHTDEEMQSTCLLFFFFPSVLDSISLNVNVPARRNDSNGIECVGAL